MKQLIERLDVGSNVDAGRIRPQAAAAPPHDVYAAKLAAGTPADA